MDMTKTNTSRKALATLIREAGAELGLSVAVVADPTTLGRLMYSVAGSKPLTPGEAAGVLGVEEQPMTTRQAVDAARTEAARVAMVATAAIAAEDWHAYDVACAQRRNLGPVPAGYDADADLVIYNVR